MANTRFKYDDARTVKALQQSTDPGRWILDVPGNGLAPDFMADSHILLQKWAGNTSTNMVSVEAALKGYNRTLSRDCLGKDEYQRFDVASTAIRSSAENRQLTTDQSRATHPAWMYRDLGQEHRFPLFWDPQANVCLPFENNTSTRIVVNNEFTGRRLHALAPYYQGSG